MPALPRRGWPKRYHERAKTAGFESWDAWCEQIEKDVGHVICGNPRAYTKTPCKSRPKKDRTRCHRHGGAAPRGAEVSSFKDGRYSKHYLPDHLLKAYEEALHDPDLTSVRKQLALAEAREAELREALHEGGQAVAVADVNRLIARAGSILASDTPNIQSLTAVVASLSAVMEDASNYLRVWHQIQDNAEHKRKLSETELKRLQTLNQFVTTEQRMKDMAVIAALLRHHVTDGKVLQAIAEDLRAYIRGEPVVHATLDRSLLIPAR